MKPKKEWWKDSFFDPQFYTPSDERHLAAAPGEVKFLMKAMGLKKGTRLLDLCCGVGRHSLLLAKRGVRVTGVDYSIPYLLEARRLARKMGLDIDFQREDMRKLRFRGQFDCAINLFTSFGYFAKEADDLKTLRGVAAALKPGGLFLLDVMNREWLLSHFKERDWQPWLGGFLLEERAWLPGARRLHTRWIRIYPDGRLAERVFSLRNYDKKSVGTLLRRAGLKPIRWWGNYQGDALSEDTNRVIVLSRKPER
ncbi:MAG: methyltransferase domain-containing protein [Elusimicrobiota bacterium]